MTLAALIITAFIIWRGILPLNMRKPGKLILSAVTFIFAMKFQLIRLFGGPMFFAPDVPGWLLLVSGWCYGTVFIFFFVLLATEIIRLLLRFCWCRIPQKKCNIQNIWLLGAVLVLSTAGVIQSTALPQIREVELSFPGLPPQASGMKAAVLTDLHADRLTGAARMAQIVQMTNALEPDVIFILGDFVDGKVEKQGDALRPLSKLRAPLGVYAVPGNHEYLSGFDEWIPFISRQGVDFLLNRHIRLPGGIVVAGITDHAAKRWDMEMPDIDKALHGTGAGDFKILLSHRPWPIFGEAGQKIDLQLSGHTHGGMMYGLDMLVALFNGGYVSGLYEKNGAKLYISDGTSIWNGFPLRLGHSHELTIIELKAASNNR